MTERHEYPVRTVVHERVRAGPIEVRRIGPSPRPEIVEPEVFHPTFVEDEAGEPIEIRLAGGRVITMERADLGLLACDSKSGSCVTIPATAAEFLAILEFFSTMAADDDDHDR